MMRAAGLRLVGRAKGRLITYRDRHRIASLLSALPIPLPRVLSLFGSDKQRDGQHSYGAFYQEHLRGLRYRAIRMLEVGLLSGDSLLAWRAYFPRATIIGLDIDNKSELAVGSRTRCYQATRARRRTCSVCASRRRRSTW